MPTNTTTSRAAYTRILATEIREAVAAAKAASLRSPHQRAVFVVAYLMSQLDAELSPSEQRKILDTLNR